MSANAALLTQIRWVCFDVGETLIDETRHWAAWADWLGVTHLTFFAALGAVIAARRDHRETFQLLRPGFDLAAARAARVAAGQPEQFGVDSEGSARREQVEQRDVRHPAARVTKVTRRMPSTRS